MKYKSVVLSVLFASHVNAADLYLIAGGFSKHFDPAGQNEIHPSIGIQYDNFSVIYVQNNSIEKQSIQVSWSNDFYQSDWVNIGYRLGLATGYETGTKFDNNKRTYHGVDWGHGIAPIAAIELTIPTPIPKLSIMVDGMWNAAVFGVKYQFN